MLRWLTCLLLIVVPARAEMPDGHDDPAYQAAVEAWLDADDAASLPSLARLAQQGNVAARILLGRLDQERRALTPWLAALSPRERKILLRAPGGTFPKSWLAVAEGQSDLAAALQASRLAENDKESLSRLIRLGEIRLARFVANRLFNFGAWEHLIATIPGATEDEILRDIAYASAFHVESDLAQEMRRQVEEGQYSPLSRVMAYRDAVDGSAIADADKARNIRWLFSGRIGLDQLRDEISDETVGYVVALPEGRGLNAVCTSQCESSRMACLRLGNSLAGGLTGLGDVGSPVETLIAQSRYSGSRREQEDVLGLMTGLAALIADDQGGEQRLRSVDPCLADMVLERIQR